MIRTAHLLLILFISFTVKPSTHTAEKKAFAITPGSISFAENSSLTSIDICHGGSITIYEDQAVSGLGLLQTANYYYEISYDNGLTWSYYENAEGDPYEFGDGLLQTAPNPLTLENITNNMLIRRYVYSTLSPSNNAYTAPLSINVQQENKILFQNDINAYAVALGETFTIPTITTSLPATIAIYDAEGNSLSQGSSISLSEGSHTLTVIATTTTAATVSGCTNTAYMQVVVYDMANCNKRQKKIYATEAVGWSSNPLLSWVSNEQNAVNNNRANYASLNGGVVILGIGTVGIDLYFTKENGTLYSPQELKGKRVTIKLGEQYSGLKVAGGLTVVGRKTDEGVTAGNITEFNGSNVGKTFGVKGGVLDLLKGDNVFQFSFSPASSNGTPVGFNGVRIQLGSLLGVADIATVFYAYIEEDYTIDPNTNTCIEEEIRVTPPASLLYPDEQTTIDGDTVIIENTNFLLNEFTEDVSWGNKTAVINAATSLSSVVHPYYAVDDNYESYAIFNTVVGVLNQQFLLTHLRQTARPGDQVQITISYPNINVLNLSLLQLGNFKVVYYLDDTKVGEEYMEEFRVLDIGLLDFENNKKAVIAKPVTIPFNKIEIQQFNTVSVNLGQGLRIHDVRMRPMMLFEGQKDPKEVTTICAADYLKIKQPDHCTTYEVSFAKVLQFGGSFTDTDGNILVDENNQPIKSILEVEDIPESALTLSHVENNIMYYPLERLYQNLENEEIILAKIQTKRQGCDYGDPEYLRVRLINCKNAVVNPVINTEGIKN